MTSATVTVVWLENAPLYSSCAMLMRTHTDKAAVMRDGHLRTYIHTLPAGVDIYGAGFSRGPPHSRGGSVSILGDECDAGM